MAKKVAKPDLTGMLQDLRKKKIDVSMLSDNTSPCVVADWISTGCTVLDKIMGGGLPVGRMTEIYGDNSTGKSLIAAQIAAVAQEQGHIVVYADTESAVSLDIMKAVGVDVDQLVYTAPDTVEEVFDFFQNCIESKISRYADRTMVLIWDSVAGTSVEQEMAADFGKAIMGTHARTISQAMRKITREFSKCNIAALFLNQTRENIGVLFGSKVTTFGGKAIGFHASVRIELRLAGKIKTARKKIIGVQTKAICVKNKIAVPYQEALLPIYFGHGIDDIEATLHWLVDNDIALKAGSYITLLLGGQEQKFKSQQWPEIYGKYYDDIYELVNSDMQDLSVPEVEMINDQPID